MKILITGVAGFIGFSFAEYLLKKNNKFKVYGIDNLDDYYSVKLKKKDFIYLNNIKIFRLKKLILQIKKNYKNI